MATSVKRRLVLIERNEVHRLGREAVARTALGETWTVESHDLDSALRDDLRWTVDDGVAAVLIVVAGDGAGFDRFDAVSVVAMIAAHRSSGQAGVLRTSGPLLVAAVAGAHNPLLHIRLVGAGADRIVPAHDVSRISDGRIGAVLTSSRVALARHAETAPQAVLDYVEREGLQHAFEPGLPQNQVGLSRRAVLRVRRDVASLGAIRPSLDRYTGGSDRRIELPTWREVVAYVNCSRGEMGWGDDAWGNGSGPRIGASRYGLAELEVAARALVAWPRPEHGGASGGALAVIRP